MTTLSPITRPRWRKVAADLWENRSRTALVVLSIAVGDFAIGTIISAYNIIAADMSVTYAESNPANIEVWTDPFDDDFLHTVERIPGVLGVEGRHRTSLRVSRDGGKTYDDISIIAIEDFSKSNIFQRTVAAGNPFPDNREMIIEELAVRTMGFELGDDLIVQLPDGTNRTIPLVGLVSDQGVIGGPDTVAVGYITMDTLEWIGRPQFYNRLYATVSGNNNDDDHIDAVFELVEDKIERKNSSVYHSILNKTNEHPMTTTVLAVLAVMGAMGALMLVLGSSLIANTLSALLSQHLRQIGVMKLIGARSQQVLGMYLVLIISFGLIALLISIPLSGIAGYQFAQFLANELKLTLQGYRFIPMAVIAQIIIAIFVPIMAGFLPIFRGSRTSVEDAISEVSIGDQSKESWLDRIGEQLSWVSRPLLISIRNTFRRRGRLMLTLFTLTMAGAIFIGVFNVKASLEGFIDDVGNLFLADVSVDFTRPYRHTVIEQAVEDIDGIVGVEGWLVGAGEVVDENDEVVKAIQLLSPPAASELIVPKILAGRWLKPGDHNAVIMPDAIYEFYPDLQIGDELLMNVQDKRAEKWTVVGVFSFPNPGDEALIGYTSYAKMSDLLKLPEQATSFRLVTEEHTLEYQDEISQQVDRLFRAKGLKVAGVQSGKSILQDASESIGILVTFFLIMAILTAFVGSIGLAGTMSMNVLERTREIGVMRAIGAQDFEIIKSVLVEGIFIGAISWIIGVVLSFPISVLLLTIISDALINSPMDLVFSYGGFVLWLVVVLILAALASILPARNAARLTIREVLAYE